MTVILGLCGWAGVGKDTAAEALIDDGWTRLALADPLKAVARRLGWDGRKDAMGRHFLQTLGEAVRLELNPDAWLDPIVDTFYDEPDRRYVITDVRYLNEAIALVAERGKILRITRPGVFQLDHQSERDLDSFDVDGMLRNDSTVPALHAAIRDVTHRWFDAAPVPHPV